MNILMLSTDDRVFEERSEVRERLKAYGPLFDSLSVIVFTRHQRIEERLAANVTLHPTPASFSPFAFRRAVALGGHILADLGRDAVITSQEAFTNLVAFVLRRRFGIPMRVEIHTDFLSPHFRRESGKNYLRCLIYRWSVRHADCIRVVSERIKQSLTSHFSFLTSRITMLPVFADVRRIAGAAPAFNLRARYAGFHPVVLWVGRLTREKNPGLALEIISELVEEFPKLLLVIVGDGPERKNLESGIMSHGLTANVRMVGWQNDVVPYYKGADALLVTSRYEGYGRMFVEAAAAGLPIVSTDVGIIGEIFRNGESAIAFHNAASGAVAIRRLAEDATLADRLRQNARAAIAGLPDLPTYLRRYREALERCRRR